MKTSVAIARLERRVKASTLEVDSTYIQAVKLGIEALKFKQEWRRGIYRKPNYLLPGETEEEPSSKE